MNNQNTLDYDDGIDPFAESRPKGSYKKIQEVQDDNDSGIDPFADSRPDREEVIKTKKENAAEKAKYKDYSRIGDEEGQREIKEQLIKKSLIGVGGTYGDLQELLGSLSGKLAEEITGSPAADYTNKAQEQRNLNEFESLTRIEEGKGTFEDIANLESEEFIPSLSFPTKKQLGALNEALGGPGEPKTPEGKDAARTGDIYGSGVAFGQFNPAPAILAGFTGQTAEELGVGPLGQAVTEIVTLLATQGRGQPISSTNAEIERQITALRNAGYSERDITLAINAEHASRATVGAASKGSRTEQAFEEFAEHSDDLVSNILTGNIPGIERGTQYVHELASSAYGQVAQGAANITITNPVPFINSATGVVRQLRNTLGNNPEAQPFLNRLYEAVMASTNQPSAQNFMNFYKELNSMGQWLGRSQRDRLINQVKNGIKDTFRAEGPAGRRLAEDFERVNEGVRKAFRAEEVHTLIQKTAGQEGIDYKKLYKLFDSPDNVHLFEEVLGQAATRNLETIARTGREIKNFDKAWKATNILGTGVNTIQGGAAAYYIFNGDMEGLAKVAASKGLTKGISKIAELSLREPAFQNLLIKGMHAIRTGSPKTLGSTIKAMQEYFDKNDIEIDLNQ